MNRKLQKEQAWWRMITSAGACFFKQGIEKTSMATIAADAGVASKTLERYFGSKQNLILTVANVYVEHAYQEILGEYHKLVAGMNGYERARIFLQCEIGFFRDHPHDAAGLLSLEVYLSKADITAEEREEHQEYYTKLRQCLTEDLYRGQRDGTVSKRIDAVEMGIQMSITCLSVVQRMGLTSLRQVNSDYLVQALLGTIKNEE